MKTKSRLYLAVVMVLLSAVAAWAGSEGPDNVLYGNGAGVALTPGTPNFWSGKYNTFIGTSAGISTTSGFMNSFIGESAGRDNTGSGGSFIGFQAGLVNTTGSYNSFIGYMAGSANTTGFNNSFIGSEAGRSNITSGGNTFIGNQAGLSNTTGNYNSYIGQGAGQDATGDRNVFLGYLAGRSATGSHNVFLGSSAGYTETGSNKLYVDNCYTGYPCTQPLIYGEFDNRIVNIDGTLSATSFVGDGSGLTGVVKTEADPKVGTLTTGKWCTSDGSKVSCTANAPVSAEVDPKVGTLTNGKWCTSNGSTVSCTADNPGYQGGSNTYFGQNAGINTGVDSGDTFIGAYAGNSNTTGSGNSFFGHYAGNSNATGYGNVFLGKEAGFHNTTGNINTFIGNTAGNSNTTGYGNIFLGYAAGNTETGSNKLYVDNCYTGYPCTQPLIYGEFDNKIVKLNGNLSVVAPDNGLIRLASNETDITTKVSRMVLQHYTNSQLPVYLFGAASVAANNFVAFGGGSAIGNAATQIDLYTAPNTTTPMGTPRITIKGDGKVGFGTQSPAYLIHLSGGAYSDGASWTDGSSRELKDNIKNLSTEAAMETFTKLTPVTFTYKTDKEDEHVGFIAEDVPDLVATKDRKGLSAMDIVAVLTKVVQEKSQVIDKQQNIIDDLVSVVSQLKVEVQRLKAMNVTAMQ